jgi:hypothetical protein
MEFKYILIIVCLLCATIKALPTLKVPKCPSPLDWNQTALVPSFTLDSGSGSPIQQTEVHVCYDTNFLYVRYDCIDNNIYSDYQNCNDDLFNEDVVEMFIAPVKSGDVEADVYHYIEMEVSPNGVLFVSNITNYSGDCTNFNGDLIPCAQSGIIQNAQRFDSQNKWWATIQIPFSLLAQMPPYDLARDQFGPYLATTTFRANFYRIDQPNGGVREFSCWSPTMANPPCFQKPAYFGTLQIHYIIFF